LGWVEDMMGWVG